MAQIFRGLPGMDAADGLLVSLRHHVRGAVHPDHGRHRHARGALRAAGTDGQGVQAVRQHCLAARQPDRHHAGGRAGWGYLIYTGNISTIWPLFGTGNQLLATIALAVSTTFLINMGKAQYAWITVPAHVLRGRDHAVRPECSSIQNIFWPLHLKPGQQFTGYLDTTLMVIFIVGVVLVLIDAVRRWIMVLNGAPVPEEAFGPPVTEEGEVKMGCC